MVVIFYADVRPGPLPPAFVALWGATEADLVRARRRFEETATLVGAERRAVFSRFVGGSYAIRRPHLPGIPLEFRLTGSGHRCAWWWYAVQSSWWRLHGAEVLADPSVKVEDLAPDSVSGHP